MYEACDDCCEEGEVQAEGKQGECWGGWRLRIGELEIWMRGRGSVSGGKGLQGGRGNRGAWE